MIKKTRISYNYSWTERMKRMHFPVFILFTCTVVALLNGSGCTTIPNLSGEKHMLTPGDEVQFRAAVVSIGYLTNYEGSAYITHFDPRFILTLDVESTDPPNCQIKRGRQVFAVHSPTYVFAFCKGLEGNRSVLRPELWGKTFDFTTTLGEHGWRTLRANDTEGLPDKKMNRTQKIRAAY